MDTYTAPTGSSKSATRAHVSSEFADLRAPLDMVAMQARSLIASLRDLPRPLYADECEKFDKARQAFAEQVLNGLHDMMGDLLGPVSKRADDAGMDPDGIAVDLSEVEMEIERLGKEGV